MSERPPFVVSLLLVVRQEHHQSGAGCQLGGQSLVPSRQEALAEEEGPSENEYMSAISVLNNAFDFLDSFIAAHKLNGVTLMPCAHIIMSTHGLDQFVGRVLRSTNPPSVDRHSFLNNWWVENARPEFARRRLAAEKEARTKEREERE